MALPASLPVDTALELDDLVGVGRVLLCIQSSVHSSVSTAEQKVEDKHAHEE